MPDYFQPDPIEEEVSAALVRILAGETADACESQRLDFKEEPGRRDEVGEVTSEGADVKATAAMLAGAASCMSNGGGGAVVLGVADDGQLIGTSLEVDWLRQRIYEMLQRRLIVDVREMHVLSHRLLVLRVPAAVEAIPYKGAIKTRVGRMCVDYDLASWTRKIQQPRLDWSAESSGIPVSSVRAAALECGREFLRRGSDDSQLGAASDADFLRRLGAVHQDGLLTNAGALLFAERPDPALDYIRRRAPGGDSALRVRIAGTSVLEQLRDVELAFRSSNT
ncbi:MAG: ATP-dependent helicase RecG, partial [Actinomycetota bacterium]|nr:ATP-dependent helicase RecG [Actinomycetota bacterium]